MSKFSEIGPSYSQSQNGGSVMYMAPEIINNEPYYNPVDVYAYGILMYQVVTDLDPYPELKYQQPPYFHFLHSIIENDLRPKFKVLVKNSLKQLIEQFWDKYPYKRPNFEIIFDKLTNGYDYYLDDVDVDVDEIKYYIDDITEIRDPVDKILDRLAKNEKENQQLKSENDQIKIEKANLIKENDQVSIISNSAT